jgi:hypothetical protein
MSSRLASVVIEAVDPSAIAEFWYVMLGGTVIADHDGSRRLVGPEIGGCDVDLVFVPAEHGKVGKNGIHVDLATESPHEYQVLTSLAVDLGARAVNVGQGPGVPWTVFQDPQGNEFCVLEPRDLYVGTGPLAALVFDAVDPVRLAEFWSAATGWPRIHAGENSVALRPRADQGPWVEFLRVPLGRRGRNRIRFDVVPGGVDDPVSWLVDLGARRSGCSLVDPEGNEIQVVSGRVRDVGISARRLSR